MTGVVEAGKYWDELMEHTTRRRAGMLKASLRNANALLWVQANWNLLLAAQYLRHTGFGPIVTFAKLLRLGYPRASRNKRTQYVVAREFWRHFALRHSNSQLPGHEDMLSYKGQLQHLAFATDPMIVRHYFVDPSLDGSIRRAIAEHRPPPPPQPAASHPVPPREAAPGVAPGPARSAYKVDPEDVFEKVNPEDFASADDGGTENYTPELRRKIDALKKQRQEKLNAKD